MKKPIIISGPQGSGKTKLANALAGMERVINIDASTTSTRNVINQLRGKKGLVVIEEAIDIDTIRKLQDRINSFYNFRFSIIFTTQSEINQEVQGFDVVQMDNTNTQLLNAWNRIISKTPHSSIPMLKEFLIELGSISEDNLGYNETTHSFHFSDKIIKLK